MSYLPQLLTLVGVWIITLVSPGPDFIVTIRYSIAHSRRDGVFVALGIATGTVIWVTLSIVGSGIMLTQLSWFVSIMRVVGALYLAYLGVKTILNAHRPMQTSMLGSPSSSRRMSSWRVGFLTNISNPKALVFFASIFVALLPIHPPFWFQVTLILMMVGTVAVWFCIVACLFSLGPIAGTYRRAKKWLDYLTGGIFVALGMRLALAK
jgi:threonine/homoserine/homoserine lactone efflux protein